MKKTIVKPDGSTVVIEGSAEEIKEYEKNLQGESSDKKKKTLLTDSVTHDFSQIKNDYYGNYDVEKLPQSVSSTRSVYAFKNRK